MVFLAYSGIMPFSVYSQSTGGNVFLVAANANVLASFKQRLTSFAASTLQSLEEYSEHIDTGSNDCLGMKYEDGFAIEECTLSIEWLY